MNNRPNRRKLNDNPYTLQVINNTYIVIFKDSCDKKQIVEVSEKVFSQLDQFELDDLKYLNEYDRHIEHSEIYENNLNSRATNKPKSLEDEIIFKITVKDIKNEISNLPKIQKNRIRKYFFENKTLDEIAKAEGVNKTSIMRAINNGLEKISKKFKV